jgi:hypothetical protein
MIHINKASKGERGRNYLVARDRMFGVKGEYAAWRYDCFFYSFLTACNEIAKLPKHKREIGDGGLALAKMQLEETQEGIKRIKSYLISGKYGANEFDAEMSELKAKESKLESDIQNLEAETLAKPAEVSELAKIDFEDTDGIRERLRATVKRVTVDAATRWMKAEFFDGRVYEIKVEVPSPKYSKNRKATAVVFLTPAKKDNLDLAARKYIKAHGLRDCTPSTGIKEFARLGFRVCTVKESTARK